MRLPQAIITITSIIALNHLEQTEKLIEKNRRPLRKHPVDTPRKGAGTILPPQKLKKTLPDQKTKKTNHDRITNGMTCRINTASTLA